MTIVPIRPDPANPVVALAREILSKAESGEFSTLIMIAVRPDGTWTRNWSGATPISTVVGLLEIFKQEWVDLFRKSNGLE